MIPQVDNLYFYSRKGNILYGVTPDAVEIPLIKFKEKFPDILILEEQHEIYIKKYMAMHPQHWELIKVDTSSNLVDTSNQQLSLF